MARPKTDDPVARARILAAAEALFAEHGFVRWLTLNVLKASFLLKSLLRSYTGAGGGHSNAECC